MEKPLFFQNKNGEKLFGILYEPSVQEQNVGIVFCQPIAEERARIRRLFVNWARFLASRGYCVLLFDYFGEGDSDGNFEDADVNSRVNDILASVEFMQNNFKLKSVGLVGLRLGATFSILAGLESNNIEFIISCQPICNGNEYIQDWFKINLSSQFVTFKKIKSNRSQLIMDLINKGTIEIEGYVLTSRFYEQLIKVDLLHEKRDILSAMLIVEIKNDNSQADEGIKQLQGHYKNKITKLKYLEIEKTFDWMNFKRIDQNPAELYQQCYDWIKTNN